MVHRGMVGIVSVVWCGDCDRCGMIRCGRKVATLFKALKKLKSHHYHSGSMFKVCNEGTL